MAEGTKERLAEEGRKQFESTASQINEGLAENKAEATTQYNKLLSNWQSNLEKQADMSAQLEEAFMNYADAWGYTEYSKEETNQGRGDWFSKYYAPGQEQNRKEILERVMYGGQDTGNSLTNTLAQENPELYDFYVSNRDYFNKMLLGIDEPGYRGEGYNWENRQSVTDKANELEQQANDLGIDMSNLDFKNATEKVNKLEQEIAKKQKEIEISQKQKEMEKEKEEKGYAHVEITEKESEIPGFSMTSSYKAEDGYEYRALKNKDRQNLKALQISSDIYIKRAFTNEVVAQIRADVADGKLKEGHIVAIPARDKRGNINPNLTYYYEISNIKNGEPYLYPVSKWKSVGNGNYKQVLN